MGPAAARCSLAVVETRTDAQTVLYRSEAADLGLCEEDVAAVDFAPVAALIVTGTALSRAPSRGATRAAMARARAQGALVVLDLDWRPSAWAAEEEAAEVCLSAAREADIVIGNDEEFGLIARSPAAGEALARSLAAQGALFTVYKRGERGSTTFTPDYRIDTGIYRVAARKPMGSGDGFMGGLMAGLAAGHTLERALQRGAATAAIIVAGIGCAPASPDTATLDAFLASR
jgi:5-dehydro-2-deoxygluconokinase